MPHVKIASCVVAAALLLFTVEHTWLWGIQARGALPLHFGDHTAVSSCSGTSCYKYYNSQTAPFLIQSWPDVAFDAGEFYAGSVAVGHDPNRTLFFIFKPAKEKVEEVVLWLNGGPGCSSLYGFVFENGPITWRPDTEAGQSRNPLAWSERTNMLWVDQPIGTGFSQGELEPLNRVKGAQEFVGFFANWERLFGIEKYRIYLTGESYAGRYIPYIAAEMLDREDKTLFDLSGALLHSPTIGNGVVQGQVPRYPFVVTNHDILNLDSKILNDMDKAHRSCGYAEYLDKYLHFPPQGSQPPMARKDDLNEECVLSTSSHVAAASINSCHNPYRITDTCPSESRHHTLFLEEYFNRKEVMEAIHAPLEQKWDECAILMRPTDDTRTPSPNQGVLARLIEATNRVLISNGDLDGVILSNGTLLAIQNTTWGGALGFQERPSRPFILSLAHAEDETFSEEQGLVMGVQHYERGLQWVESYRSGHMQPQYQPRVALRMLDWMLGRIDKL